jgi:hypothetical protein
METFLEALKKTPELLAIVAIVWGFLRHLKESSKQQADTHKAIQSEFATTIREISTTATRAQERSSNAIERNAEALATNTAATREATAAFKGLTCKWQEPHKH